MFLSFFSLRFQATYLFRMSVLSPELFGPAGSTRPILIEASAYYDILLSILPVN
jgi:hypothetical protein